MLDIGWQEIFIIGGLALIVVGPKDLPRALRTAMLGVRKVRGLAKDFQDGVDEMVREANLDDFKKEMEKIKQDEIERDLKHGVIDNTMNFDSVKDDLNQMADAPKAGDPEILNQSNAAASTTKPESIKERVEKAAEANAASTKAAEEKPAREPVKRKKRGSATPTAKAAPKKAAAKKTAAKKSAAKKTTAKKTAAKKTVSKA